MATEVKSKGSIIYKLLIVILGAALVATILYPKKLWKTEDQNVELCRDNMEHILYVEYAYLSHFNAFTDTLENAISFIKDDTTGLVLRQFINTDSSLSTKIIKSMSKLEYGVKIDSIGDSTRLVPDEEQIGLVMLDATNAADTTIVSTGAIISFDGFMDRLDQFTRYNGIDTVEAFILDSLRFFPVLANKIDSMGVYALDHLAVCPTSLKQYQIQVIDTSAIKELNVFCPVDSLDSLHVSLDFKLSKIGGLRISNHGAVVNGEKSWAQ
jgi:hypothetical protein